jgi:hypothetical protein
MSLEQSTIEEIEYAVQRAFSAGVGDKRYIDVSRVPLLCQSILGIDKKLDEMQKAMVTQDQFWPVKTLVYGIVGLMLTGIVGALLFMVVK